MKRQFNHFLYLKPGIGFIQKKGHVKRSRFFFPTEATVNCIQVPANIGLQGINSKTSEKIRLGFELGTGLNLVASSNDRLEYGLHPNNKVTRNTIIPVVNAGLNLEFKLNKKPFLFINYQYSKDLAPFFNRRYTFTSTQVGQPAYMDFDLRLSTHSLAFGLFFK